MPFEIWYRYLHPIRSFVTNSNLTNFLFGSAKSREEKDTLALYQRVREKYDRSRYANMDAGYDFLTEIIKEGCEYAEVVPSEPLIDALYEFTGHLLVEDGALWEFPTLESLDALTLEEGVKLRELLHRKERFLADDQRLSALWRHKVASIVSGVMSYLPVSVFTDDGEESAPPFFSAQLVDLLETPAVVVERTIMTVVDQDIVDARLLEPTRERLDNNAVLASGIRLEEKYSTKKDIVLPEKAKVRSNVELVEKYLRGTAFQILFESRLPFAIPFPARFEHTHIVGGSGHGKTQLMQMMIHHDLQQAQTDGRSVVVIDSQGDLIRTISHLDCFAAGAYRSLSDRLLLIDPTDIEYPVCLNMFDWQRERLASFSPLEREKLLNSAIDLYEYLFGALLGAELTQRQGVIFKYIARLMLEIPGATIQTLRQLMEHGEPFRPYMDKLPGSARSFFATRFFDRSFGETKKQILTRLWGVLSNATLERMFSHERNKVDLYEAINSGKIILINTAKDLLKEDGCAIFGRFFIALLAQAVQQRAALPPHERNPCFVYIDEAQDYFDQTAEHLLNQARKYRVGMVLAHQNLDQLAASFRASVMSSTSIKFAGGVSAKDARVFADEMRCEADFVQGMRKHKSRTEFACYVKSLTPQAIGVTVPLGHVEAQETMSGEEYRSLVENIRLDYCATLEEADRLIAAEQVRVLPEPRTRQSRSAPEQDVSPPAATPNPEAPKPTGPVRATPADPVPPQPPQTPQSDAIPLARLLPTTKPPKPVKAREPLAMGRGGQQHVYLQHLIKQLGEERGFRAVIEQPILDGVGKVDVALFRGEQRIACEISVSTSREQELGNIEKCLAAGFEQVMLVTPSERHLKTVSRFVAAHLDEGARDRVRYVAPDAVVDILDSIAVPPSDAETVVRGYKVKVTRQVLAPEEARIRREAIARVVSRSLKQSAREAEPST